MVLQTMSCLVGSVCWLWICWYEPS